MKKIVVAVLAALMCFAQARAQNANANPRAFDAAMAHFRSNAKAYGLTDPDRELRQRSAISEASGASHIRFDQFFQGVKVFEGEAISHVSAKGDVTVTNALRGGLAIDTTPAISAASAESAALAHVGSHAGASVDSELEILPKGERSDATLLVWHVKTFVENDAEGAFQYDTFVDAKSGRVVWSFDSLETAKPGSGGGGTFTATTGTGNLMYIGPKTINIATNNAGTWRLEDQTRGLTLRNSTYKGNYTLDLQNRTTGGSIVSGTSSTFGDGVVDSTNRATAAAEVHFGLATTLDYYLNVHGRRGIDDNNGQTYSRVHYSNSYNNAFWSDSCFCMTYGDGSGTPGGTSGFLPLVSIDVAGHEMTHGVTSRSANLTYSGESGGLNEATSDMFGTFVEYYANSSKDPGDWLIGEMIYPSNYNTDRTWKNLASPKALRYMTKPSLDGQSPNCWSATLGSLDVHYSSGPANHMMYLLANGGTSACNGASVSGVGVDAASKIWYRALTVYMTSSTNYAGARTAALNAAADLYGSGSAQYAAVAAAFSAINVN